MRKQEPYAVPSGTIHLWIATGSGWDRQRLGHDLKPGDEDELLRKGNHLIEIGEIVMIGTIDSISRYKVEVTEPKLTARLIP